MKGEERGGAGALSRGNVETEEGGRLCVPPQNTPECLGNAREEGGLCRKHRRVAQCQVQLCDKERRERGLPHSIAPLRNPAVHLSSGVLSRVQAF